MEKCPYCHENTIEVKKKLALSPRDILVCPECKTKLALDSNIYFVHGVYLFIVGLAIFKLQLILGILAVIMSSALALYLIIKIIPFKIIQ